MKYSMIKETFRALFSIEIRYWYREIRRFDQKDDYDTDIYIATEKELLKIQQILEYFR